jgi:4-amino-4-deoxy-L-arabinose transferase-like glycosyltransferase
VIVPDALTSGSPRHERQPTTRRWPVVLESVSVVLSPLIAFFVLRLRAMSPVDLPDPSMHTVYIVDPSQMFTRYAAAFAATARMREGAQVGFLVLARLAYLGFGALPGFFVTRYFFALVAVVPAYVLVRKLYGIPAAVLAAVVLLSSPVIITAWGTDYPDSAVVSYVAGAVACLAMPCRDRWRPLWLVAAGSLLTLATWSHGMGIVLAITTVVVYGLVRLARLRRHLLREGTLLAAVAVSSTVILMFASRAVLGQFDFIRPTLAGASFLDHPDQIRQWHSANWRWAPYVEYLLVPPSVILAFWLTFARRLRKIPTPQLFVGLVCTVQFAAFAYLQFVYHVQALELHFFSSTLWGVVCLALAVMLAEIARPISAQRLVRWMPAVLVLAVPLVFETYPHVPAFTWVPAGTDLALVPVLLAVVMRSFTLGGAVHSARRLRFVMAVAISVIGVTGSLLVLTVAPRPAMPPMKGLAAGGDPSPTYEGALGGSATSLIDWYALSASIPRFVGEPTYKGEQLLMWFRWGVPQFLEPVGIFHEGFDSLGPGFPVLSAADERQLARRKPAEMLLFSLTGDGFPTALTALARYKPVLIRTTVLRHGRAVLHAWLIILRSFARRSVWPTTTT